MLRNAAPVLSHPILLSLLVVPSGCRSGEETAPSAAAPVAVVARVIPSTADEHLDLLPSPVQLLLQVRPGVLFAEPTLAVTAGALLAGLADDPAGNRACIETLGRDIETATYAWIGGETDGWVLVVDGDIPFASLGSCLAALGTTLPIDGWTEPAIGETARLDRESPLLLARLGPTRRLVGSEAAAEAVRRLAAPREGDAAADVPVRPAVLSRLRLGELKLYVDFDELIDIGAEGIALSDDAARVGLSVRIDAGGVKVVVLAEARGGLAAGRLSAATQDALRMLRRLVVDDPRVPASTVYEVFDRPRIERDDRLLRLEVEADRPTFSVVVGMLARRLLLQAAEGALDLVPDGPPEEPAAPPPEPADAGADAPPPEPADAGADAPPPEPAPDGGAAP